MGLERLHNGCFASNSLVLQSGMLAYNMLRIIGKLSLEEIKNDELPGSRSRKVSRRRIHTVIQDLIYMADSLIHTGKRWLTSFGQMNPYAQLAERIYNRLHFCPVKCRYLIFKDLQFEKCRSDPKIRCGPSAVWN
jgi:hypothetical protein